MRQCNVCDDAFDEGEVAGSTYGENCSSGSHKIHRSCPVCLGTYWSVEIRSSHWGNIKCYDPNCGRLLSREDMESFLITEDLVEYDAKLFKKTLDSDPEFHMCSASDCKSGQLVEGLGIECSEFKCHSCDKVTQVASKKVEMDEATQALIGDTSKPCPRLTCGALISKTEGCSHVTCTNCTYEFCWYCGANYAEIKAKNGPGRSAHKPECPLRFERVSEVDWAFLDDSTPLERLIELGLDAVHQFHNEIIREAAYVEATALRNPSAENAAAGVAIAMKLEELSAATETLFEDYLQDAAENIDILNLSIVYDARREVDRFRDSLAMDHLRMERSFLLSVSNRFERFIYFQATPADIVRPSWLLDDYGEIQVRLAYVNLLLDHKSFVEKPHILVAERTPIEMLFSIQRPFNKAIMVEERHDIPSRAEDQGILAAEARLGFLELQRGRELERRRRQAAGIEWW